MSMVVQKTLNIRDRLIDLHVHECLVSLPDKAQIDRFTYPWLPSMYTNDNFDYNVQIDRFTCQ